jgi:hypothetical protein
MPRPRRRNPAAPPSDTPTMQPLLHPAEAAPLLGSTVQSLRQQRYRPRGPLGRLPYYRISERDIRYGLDDILALREACRIEPAAPELESEDTEAVEPKGEDGS